MRKLDVASARDAAQNGLLATAILTGETGVSGESITVLMDRTQRALKFQREQGDLLTPQALQVLLNVAIQPGITMQALQKPTGLNLSSVSRNLTALGKYHRLGKEGLDFCETIQDPVERRRMIAFLTRKGRDFLSNYLTILTGQPVMVDTPLASEWVTRTHRSAAR